MNLMDAAKLIEEVEPRATLTIRCDPINRDKLKVVIKSRKSGREYSASFSLGYASENINAFGDIEEHHVRDCLEELCRLHDEYDVRYAKSWIKKLEK